MPESRAVTGKLGFRTGIAGAAFGGTATVGAARSTRLEEDGVRDGVGEVPRVRGGGLVERLGSGGFGDGPRDGGRGVSEISRPSRESEREAEDGDRLTGGGAGAVERLSTGLIGTETVPSMDMRRIEGTVTASLLDLDDRWAALVGTGGLSFDGPATGPPVLPKRSFIALTDTARSSTSSPAFSAGFARVTEPLFAGGVRLVAVAGPIGSSRGDILPWTFIVGMKCPVD